MKRQWITGIGVVVLTILMPLSVAAAPTVSSASAVVYEPQSGRFLYEKSADTRRPMASTTKLMTALVAAEALSADEMMTVAPSAVLVEGSAVGLRGGDTLTVRDTLAGLLLSSGNDAANALAIRVSGSLPAFAIRMNAKAAELGMSRSVFVTPSGLDAGDHASTARDMALLGAAVLQQPLLAQLCATKQTTVHINGNPVTLTNHNRLLGLYPDCIGLKTGYTKKSGKCLVSAAARDGVTLVVATLNGGDYWNDHIALYEHGFSQTESVSLALPTLPTVAVCGGVSETVTLTATEPSPAVLLVGERDGVTVEWDLPRFVWAPVEQGDNIGTLRYRVGERVLATVDLRATEPVAARAALSFFKKWQRYIVALWNVAIK